MYGKDSESLKSYKTILSPIRGSNQLNKKYMLIRESSGSQYNMKKVNIQHFPESTEKAGLNDSVLEYTHTKSDDSIFRNPIIEIQYVVENNHILTACM